MVKARGITMTSFDVFLLIAFTVSVLTGAACMFVPRNPILGIRIAWSEYNDVTWKKSNKFLGILLIIVGIVSMITFFTISSDMAEIVFLVLLIASLLISVIYSKFVCAKEKEKH